MLKVFLQIWGRYVCYIYSSLRIAPTFSNSYDHYWNIWIHSRKRSNSIIITKEECMSIFDIDFVNIFTWHMHMQLSCFNDVWKAKLFYNKECIRLLVKRRSNIKFFSDFKIVIFCFFNIASAVTLYLSIFIHLLKFTFMDNVIVLFRVWLRKFKTALWRLQLNKLPSLRSNFILANKRNINFYQY